MDDLGVYVLLSSDGKLKRDLAALNGKIPLEDSTVEQEIIEFSELLYGPYVTVVNYIAVTANYMLQDYRENNGNVDRNVFEFMMDTVNDLLVTFEGENPLHGTLTRAAVEDTIPKDDGTDLAAIQIAGTIIAPMQEIVYFQVLVNQILSDIRNGVPLDFKEKYRVLQRTNVIQTLFMDEDLTQRYYFRSPANYYRFLLLNFITRKPRVELCSCCGKFFIPKTKKATTYCDRILKDGKTCKYWGPKLKHRLEAMNRRVVEEFDRAKQRMYKRYERAQGINRKQSEKDLTLSELYEWIDAATDARNAFLRGELSEEDALKIIAAP